MNIYGAKVAAELEQAEKEKKDQKEIDRLKAALTERKRRSRSIEIGSRFAAVFAVLCILFGFWPNSDAHPHYKSVLFVVWVVIVPLWFALETFYLYDPTLDASPEILKQGQDVSSKAWLAVSAVLAALYFGKDCFHR